MESSDSEETFERPLVNFQLSMPPEITDNSEVLTLLEVLKEDIEGFDDMLLEALQQQNQTEEHCESNVTMAEPEPIQNPVSYKETPNEEKSRFKCLSEKDLLEIERNQYSDATKRNTKWGIGVFNAWCLERLNETHDLEVVDASTLNESLRKFYAEAQPKNLVNRSKAITEEQAQEYHKNSMKNVRAAINRHLKDIGREIDIVRDKEFI
ncbi:uncharacterized protein LOC134239501 [Saccostrea cucullata]|uniref:uncharacterized protein LOC134239501 n=1 Tax=Saccostrea cuccullata TaxID=36930 RepID=UPI002ED65029